MNPEVNGRKRIMRKNGILAAILALTVLLAGCGVSSAPNPTEQTEPPVYDSNYLFFDYGIGEYIESQVGTYQAVTGAQCELSSVDFAFLQDDYSYVVEGYDEQYGVFLYAYDAAQLDQYRAYLAAIGFHCTDTERFEEGFSYYFTDSETGFEMDLFVAADKTYLAVEPFLNSNPTE